MYTNDYKNIMKMKINNESNDQIRNFNRSELIGRSFAIQRKLHIRVFIYWIGFSITSFLYNSTHYNIENLKTALFRMNEALLSTYRYV